MVVTLPVDAVGNLSWASRHRAPCFAPAGDIHTLSPGQPGKTPARCAASPRMPGAALKRQIPMRGAERPEAVPQTGNGGSPCRPTGPGVSGNRRQYAIPGSGGRVKELALVPVPIGGRQNPHSRTEGTPESLAVFVGTGRHTSRPEVSREALDLACASGFDAEDGFPWGFGGVGDGERHHAQQSTATGISVLSISRDGFKGNLTNKPARGSQALQCEIDGFVLAKGLMNRFVVHPYGTSPEKAKARMLAPAVLVGGFFSASLFLCDLRSLGPRVRDVYAVHYRLAASHAAARCPRFEPSRRVDELLPIGST